MLWIVSQSDLVAKQSDLPNGYTELLDSLKAEITAARTQAALKVNQELICLYWRVGRHILYQQEAEGWGSKVIDRLSSDLRRTFPRMKGLSRTNLHYMRAFAAAWTDKEIVQQLAGQLPWGHNMVLLDRIETQDTRVWYTRNAVANGWTRNLLEHHISTQRHLREGQAPNNFADTVPEAQSELVSQIAHDPLNLEFLDLASETKERDLEQALLTDVQRFMLELGAGFSFVGSQFPVEVDNETFYIDLLFFHIPLNRYVVIDLKVGKFRPSDAGQVNFYVNVVDDKIALDHHESTIGLILCASKTQQVVKYALGGLSTPVGVSGFKTKPTSLDERVPTELKDQLPDTSELEAGLQRIASEHAEELELTDDEDTD